jgi:hypothetical protein
MAVDFHLIDTNFMPALRRTPEKFPLCGVRAIFQAVSVQWTAAQPFNPSKFSTFLFNSDISDAGFWCSVRHKQARVRQTLTVREGQSCLK